MARFLTFALLSALAVAPAWAQVPSPQAVQQALQQPGLADVLRSRIRESGLSAEQIRARLQAVGYPATLLDPYLGAAVAGQAEQVPGQAELNAIQALGLPAITGQIVTLDTGLVRMPLGPPSGVFGVDVFRRSTTQFLPLLSGPVPPDYKLGPGDVLVLILTGEVELAYTLQLTREGFVFIPQVGQVFLANLTLGQARGILGSRLGRVYAGVRGPTPNVRYDLSVANVRANQVYVVGEVTQPGAYQISALGTVLTALYAAGGVTERANMRQIEVQRLGKAVSTLDLYDYLLRGDTRADIRLETGDVLFVPVHGTRVRVSGAVVRPAVYELKGGESLRDALISAGGFRPDANFQRVAVHRLLPAAQRGPGAPPRAVIDVPLSLPPPHRGSSERGAVGDGLALSGVFIPPLALLDGDSVVVDEVNPLAGQPYVAIAGMVEKPNRYPWQAGMTLRDLMLLARGPRVGADLREAEIARLPENRERGALSLTVRVPLDSSYLSGRDSAGRYTGAPGVAFPAAGTAPEVPLQPFDNVLIFRQPDFELQRTVTITGEVQYPGSYALRSKDERLAALIERAGGLTPQAYAEGIRFVRALNGTGRINVDLRRALRNAGSRDNLILQPGDAIDIPEFLPSVKVTGAVNSPGSVLYRPGAGLDYYVNAAGGFLQRADEKHVSVRFADGEVRTKTKWLIFSSKPTPGPGSEVEVPFEDPTQKTDYVSLFGAIAQILASTVAIIVVATR